MDPLAPLDAARLAEVKRDFQTFLKTDDIDSKYMGRIRSMMEALETRLIVSINDLRDWNKAIAQQLIASPLELLPAFEAAVKDAVLDADSGYFTKVADKAASTTYDRNEHIHVGFEGNFGDSSVAPRTLTAEHLCRLVAVEGIVSKCALVRPKVVRSVHYCPKTGAMTAREYRDEYDTAGLPTGSIYPTKDDAGNRLETEFGYCTFKNSQTITVQDMPESSPLGQIPRWVTCYCEGDLVDKVKPGDRVTVVGIYRALAAGGTATSGNFRTALLTCSVQRLSKEVGRVHMTQQDVTNIRAIAARTDGFQLFSRSLAPSIYGHKYAKQALALLMLGGLEHNLDNGTHIRGDINILMVGDPSTAKSQLLRFVLNIAPVAINTTGRGSSGVGLTAAVTTDPDTKERRLEAGAMVLADQGIVCIDEFDKMSESDRVAIHEVMEQQTVTIAKAGIQASLNARCSVVAAANPIYGRFDNSLPLAKNVALPDSLLSRFDLVFIVRDRIDPIIDSRLASHVIRMHRYVRPGSEGLPVPLDATALTEGIDEDRAEDDESTSPVFQRYNPMLHGGAAAEASEDHAAAAAAAAADGTGGAAGGAAGGAVGGAGTSAAGGAAASGASSSSRKVELLTMEFVRKFVHHARRLKPVLTNEARASIVEFYSDFRQRAKDRATTITARSLETLIRLSTAHAKFRLSKLVVAEDVEAARSIMQFALYADATARKVEGPRGAAAAQAAVAATNARDGAAAGAASGGDGSGGDGGGGDGAGGDSGSGGGGGASVSGVKRKRNAVGADAAAADGTAAKRKRLQGSASQRRRRRLADEFAADDEEEAEAEAGETSDEEEEEEAAHGDSDEEVGVSGSADGDDADDGDDPRSGRKSSAASTRRRRLDRRSAASASSARTGHDDPMTSTPADTDDGRSRAGRLSASVGGAAAGVDEEDGDMSLLMGLHNAHATATPGTGNKSRASAGVIASQGATGLSQASASGGAGTATGLHYDDDDAGELHYDDVDDVADGASSSSSLRNVPAAYRGLLAPASSTSSSSSAAGGAAAGSADAGADYDDDDGWAGDAAARAKAILQSHRDADRAAAMSKRTGTAASSGVSVAVENAVLAATTAFFRATGRDEVTVAALHAALTSLDASYIDQWPALENLTEADCRAALAAAADKGKLVIVGERVIGAALEL